MERNLTPSVAKANVNSSKQAKVTVRRMQQEQLRLKRQRQADAQDVAHGSLGGNENIVNPTQTDDNKIVAATRKGKNFVPRTKFSNAFSIRAATMPLEPTYRSRDDTNQKEKPAGWIQRTCVGENCSKRQKSGKYVRKPGTAKGDDQDLCFTCWSRDHVKKQNKKCYVCEATTTACAWQRSTLFKGKDLCNKCYKVEKRTRLEASGMMQCSSCGTDNSSGDWILSKDKSEGRKYLCNKCYLTDYTGKRKGERYTEEVNE
jgi:hypothetical protein